MNLLDAEPEVGGTRAPDIEVLIKEARRRQRRRQARAAVTLLVIVGIGLGIGMGFSGGGGDGGHARNGGGSGGGRGGRASSSGGTGPSRVLASSLLPTSGYQISVEHGRIAVDPTSGWTQNGCETRLLDPRTLHIDATNRGCPGMSALPKQIVVDFRGAGDEIRVVTSGGGRGKPLVGPVLMTLANWDWAHSGAIAGDGALWIYGLNSSDTPSALLEVSTRTGAVLRRFRVPAGADPFMAANADGFWITQSSYGGSFCARRCTLWHVAPGSSRLVAVRPLGVGMQWLMTSSDSIYADVLTRAHRHTNAAYGLTQTIWRLDGPDAHVAYRAPATLLPSTDFAAAGSATGYVVIGGVRQGFFTLTQLGKGGTPHAGGDCDTAAPIRLIRIDPATGAQSYVATLPRSDAGPDLDCHLNGDQAALYDGAFYLLADAPNNLYEYAQVVRLPT